MVIILLIRQKNHCKLKGNIKTMEQEKWFYEQNFLMPFVAETKEDAIKQLGNLLLENGFVKESFVPAVIAREKEFATGLPTNDIGVAIPHTDAHHVTKQAIAVGLLSDPVKFCVMGDPFDSEIDVQLILMLAVPNKEKVMTVLTQVMEIIQNPTFLKTMAEQKNREELVAMLDKQLNAGIIPETKSEEHPKETSLGTLEVTEVINHPVGLHARPATLFVKAASKYSSEINLVCNGRQANAKSILGVLSLGANQGCEITIQADGADAKEALLELQELIASNFGGID